MSSTSVPVQCPDNCEYNVQIIVSARQFGSMCVVDILDQFEYHLTLSM